MSLYHNSYVYIVMDIKDFNTFALQRLVLEKENEQFLLENTSNLTH